MPLVEVVATAAADPAVLDRATALMTAWGKVPVRCRDTPGFIVNRVNRPFTLEALAMLGGGEASIETIDAAMRADGFPMGPFELMDLVGIDINLAAARGVFAGSRRGRRPAGRAVPPVADPGAARRGRPARPQDRRRASTATTTTDADRARAGASSVPTGPAPTLDAGAIAGRIMLAIVNEAYRAAGDGVATPADIDLAMRLGANHPSGPFERATALGGPGAVLDVLRGWSRHRPALRAGPVPRRRR